MRRRPFFFLVAALALVAGCSSSNNQAESPGTTVPTTSDARGGVPVGYPTDVDALSALVITAVAPDPIPVAGTDGKVVASLDAAALASRTVVTMEPKLEPDPEIPVGRTAASCRATRITGAPRMSGVG